MELAVMQKETAEPATMQEMAEAVATQVAQRQLQMELAAMQKETAEPAATRIAKRLELAEMQEMAETQIEGVPVVMELQQELNPAST